MAPRSREFGIANGEASSGGAGQPRTDSREKSARRTQREDTRVVLVARHTLHFLVWLGFSRSRHTLTHFCGTPSTAPLSIGVRWWRVGPGTAEGQDVASTLAWTSATTSTPSPTEEPLASVTTSRSQRRGRPLSGVGGRAAADGCFAQVGRRARRESEGETRRRRRSVSAMRAILTTSLQWLSSYGSRTQRGARILPGERAWLSGALASCVSSS